MFRKRVQQKTDISLLLRDRNWHWWVGDVVGNQGPGFMERWGIVFSIVLSYRKVFFVMKNHNINYKNFHDILELKKCPLCPPHHISQNR